MCPSTHTSVSELSILNIFVNYLAFRLQLNVRSFFVPLAWVSVLEPVNRPEYRLGASSIFSHNSGIVYLSPALIIVSLSAWPLPVFVPLVPKVCSWVDFACLKCSNSVRFWIYPELYKTQELSQVFMPQIKLNHKAEHTLILWGFHQSFIGNSSRMRLTAITCLNPDKVIIYNRAEMLWEEMGRSSLRFFYWLEVCVIAKLIILWVGPYFVFSINI